MSASLPIPLANPRGFDLAGRRATHLRAGRPEEGTLHRVVRENLRTLYAAAEEGFAGAPLPGFVRAGALSRSAANRDRFAPRASADEWPQRR